MKQLFSILVLWFMLLLAAAAKITMSVLFQDNMVLQRDTPIQIFGGASEGAPIKVQFNGIEKETIAHNGEWMIILDTDKDNGSA
jgi:sialate O-acetylesterase